MLPLLYMDSFISACPGRPPPALGLGLGLWDPPPHRVQSNAPCSSVFSPHYQSLAWVVSAERG